MKNQPLPSSPRVLTRIARSFLYWVVALLVLVIITLTAVRLIMVPAFLSVEYNMPGFPSDPYGFTKGDRLYWSNIALDYLLNDAGIEFLSELEFPDGSPVYNQRELTHMIDVKNTLGTTLKVWGIAWVLIVGLGVWARYGSWWDDFVAGVTRGGWITVILVCLIVVFVILGFGVFFVAFHNVFFEPGTWMFNYSDTLIRLFPERFWKDIFIYVGGLSILGGLGLGWGLPRIRRR